MGSINRTISTVMSHEKTPLVLTIVSCTGVIATAYMAARAAPKAQRILEEYKNESVDLERIKLKEYMDISEVRLPLKVKIAKTWKIWLPTVGVGAVTIASIITMNRVSERNAAILSASAILATNTLKDYQQHVLEEIGPEKDSKIRDKMAKTALSKADLSDETAELLMLSNDEGTVVFDGLSGRYFRYNGTTEDIRSVENDLNHQIISQNYVSLNDVYEALGLDGIQVGDMLGFNTDNMIDFHFSAQLDPKKRPVLVLDYINPPVTAFNY